MKSFSKRVLSFFVALVMCMTIIPFSDFTLEVEAATSVKSKLDSIIATYPNGSRWTGTFDGGSECYGFAKLVVYKIFGKSTVSGKTYRSWTYAGISESGMDNIGSTKDYSAASVKNLLSKAKCGDALQFNTPKQHSMIVYSVDSDGVWIYDCNWDNNCGISLRKCSFGSWAGRNSGKLTLLRSSNYSSFESEQQFEVIKEKEATPVYLQTDSRWKKVKYGYSNEAGTIQAYIGTGAGGLGSGCGLLALTNAVAYLTGNFLDPADLAEFSLKNGLRVNGIGTSHAFPEKAAAHYGKTYKFKFDRITYYDADLIEHLKNGGVALATVPNHFIAIVDYNTTTKKFLVYDSAPTFSRGTTPNGDWKTQAQINYGALKTDKFWLLSSTIPSVETLPSTHSHSYWTGTEAAHPHKEFKKCYDCGYYYYTGKTTNSSNCSSCNSYTTKSYTVGNYSVNTSAGLNVRSGPGAGYSRVTAYTNGTKMRIEQVSGNWGKCSDGWVCLDYTKYISALEPLIKVPGTSTLKLTTAADIPTGGIVTVSWNAASDATCYKITLKNSSGTAVKTVDNFKGTTTSFTIKDAGTYSVSIVAKNSKYSGTETTLSTKIIVHAPLTVTFVDHDGQVISKQSVPYGESATVPSSPSRYGFTFSEWSGSYKNVKSNQTVTVKYQRNKYTVKFFDEEGNLLSSQKIYYESSAKAPDYTPNTGYTFVEWNKSFDKIIKDTSITAVVKWKDTDMQVVVSNLKAVRETDGTGVTVTYNVTNQKNTITSARAIVVLKTSAGKLVTTTESAAFSIKNNVTKSQEVFVPTSNASYLVEVYIVEDYKTAVPISSCVSSVIDQGTSNWTSWGTTQSTSDAIETQSRKEYRYRDKEFTTSSSSSKSGWTKYDTTWSWSSYGSWSGWSDTKVTASDSRQVETREVQVTAAYTQYRYGRRYSSAAGHSTFCTHGQKSGYSYVTQYTSWSNTRSGWVDYDGEGDWADWGCGICGTNFATYRPIAGSKAMYYWEETKTIPATTKIQYRYRDRSKVYTYHFWKWGSYTSWGTTAVTATDNRQVETRTTYRYRTNDIVGTEDTSGVLRTIGGTVDVAYAGKQALLMVYKVDEASDYSNQYVKQLTIGSDGSFSAEFKLLEEPSVKSGDYTVTLGIVGTNEAIYLETIDAPKPTYTVTFRDGDTIVSQQTMNEGENAIVPDAPEKEGYRFVYWDSTGTNIKDNQDIYAHYEKLNYTVVFINWSDETYDIHTYEHGQPLASPSLDDTDDSRVIGWDTIVDENIGVTENMVITAKYETKQFNIKFLDWDGNVIKEQIVNYGESADVPESLEEKDYIFYHWSSDKDFHYVTEDAIVVPVYSFEETVETPIVDIEDGDYDSVQTVTISCSTEDAVIYYTLDGSDPAEENGIEYTGPITIDHSCRLRVKASAFHMNDSYEESRHVAINTEQMTSDWISYKEIPSYVLENLVDYNLITQTGYRYKNTTSADKSVDAKNLEEAGWTLEISEYGEYSGWMLEYPDVTGLIDPEIEEKDPDPEPTPLYQYSRWKYYSEDEGEYLYSKSEIDEVEGEWEYIKLKSQLSVSAFDGEDRVFSYNGENWYNQSVVIEDVVPDYKIYRYRSKISTYYMWSDWGIVAPDEDEAREYESGDVYKYTAPEKYVVTFKGEGSLDSAQFLTYANEPVDYDLSKFEIEGYTFDGAFTDAEYTNSWDLENDIVTDSMSLYLKWTPKTYTVTFKGFDGVTLDTQQVEYLDYAETPVIPEVDGYVLCGIDVESLLITGDTVISAVYVAENDYVKLSLDKTSYALYTGTSFELGATVTPAEAENKEVYWVSTNENVAVVDDNGRVTAVGAGVAEIIATCDETGYSESCEITVTKNVNETILVFPGVTCSFDEAGQLRGVKTGVNTVDKMRNLFVNTDLRFISANGVELSGDSIVGTGSKIQLLSSNDEVIDETTVVITGDVTGDGLVNNRDVAMVVRYLVEKETLTLCQITAVDVNGDGKANNRDAAMLSRYLVGKEVI